jgi:hypothetical protein
VITTAELHVEAVARTQLAKRLQHPDLQADVAVYHRKQVLMSNSSTELCCIS